MQEHIPGARVLAAALLALFLAACSDDSSGPGGPGGFGGPGGRPQGPIAVSVVRPELQVVTDAFLEREATLFSVAQVVLSTRQEGFVLRSMVEAGDLVREGDLLVELEPRDHELSLREQRAALRRARATRGEHERSAKRAAELHQGRVISIEEKEDREAALERAHADVEEAKAGVERAEQALEELRIVAPMDGVVSELVAETGEYLTRGDPLVEMMRVDTLMAVCTVNEQFIAQIREGAPVQMTVSAYPSRKFEGMVWKVMPDALLESRSFPVKVLVPNPDLALKPGMSAQVRFVRRLENALLIPRDAVQREADGAWVWRVENGQVERREVELGQSFDAHVLVRSGLTPEDTIVVIGNEMLEVGSEVRVAELPPAGPPTLPSSLEAGTEVSTPGS